MSLAKALLNRPELLLLDEPTASLDPPPRDICGPPNERGAHQFRQDRSQRRSLPQNEYFRILVDTMLVTRVDGWSESVQKQLLQAPKFYFFDCGVLNALTGELASQLRESSFRYGRLFEAWVVQDHPSQ